MALNRNPSTDTRPTNRYTENVGFVSLYLDDIDAIARHLESQCERVTIAAGRATADSADDLLGATTREFENVRIETENPEVWVVVRPNYTTVVTWEDDEKARLVVRNVARVLRGHQTPIVAVAAFAPVFAFLVMTLLFLWTIAAISVESTPEAWNQIMTYSIVIASGVVVVVFATIRAVRTWKMGGAWLRKSSRAKSHGQVVPIGIAVVSAAAAAAVSVVVTVLVQRFFV